MYENPPAQVFWEAIIINSILIIMFLGQAWVNFRHKRLSRFSIDALGFFLATTFLGRRTRQRTLALRNDPKRILVWGILAILGATGGIYQIVELINNFTH
jgi:hypothetical protein